MYAWNNSCWPNYFIFGIVWEIPYFEINDCTYVSTMCVWKIYHSFVAYHLTVSTTFELLTEIHVVCQYTYGTHSYLLSFPCSSIPHFLPSFISFIRKSYNQRDTIRIYKSVYLKKIICGLWGFCCICIHFSKYYFLYFFGVFCSLFFLVSNYDYAWWCTSILNLKTN